MLTRAGRCRWLLLSLITMVIAYPYADHRPLIGLGLTSFVIISGLQALESDGRNIRFYRLLAGVQIICTAWAVHGDHLLGKATAVILLAGFYVIAMESVLRFTMRGRRVNTEKIVGAVCGYMLAAFLWAAMYRLVLLLHPQAFGGQVDVIYFSFVTLSTIGYGDMSPLPGVARSLAILEGVFGIFYIAVLVSRLVNLAGGGEAYEADET